MSLCVQHGYSRAYEALRDHEQRLALQVAEFKAEQSKPARYVWRTAGDHKVRPEHAANNGRVFSWDAPPPTGHPGDGFNCRCRAEPYVSGQSEYASLTLLSNVIDSSAVWHLPELAVHFYFGGGRTVTLSEMGRFHSLTDYYFYKIIQGGKNTAERIKEQIIQAARSNPIGQFSYKFDNTYDFQPYFHPFGKGAVNGEFNGISKLKNNMIYINGIINIEYNDVFTDIVSIREKIINSSDPKLAHAVIVFATDFGGSHFPIIQNWNMKFESYSEINSN